MNFIVEHYVSWTFLCNNELNNKNSIIFAFHFNRSFYLFHIECPLFKYPQENVYITHLINVHVPLQNYIFICMTIWLNNMNNMNQNNNMTIRIAHLNYKFPANVRIIWYIIRRTKSSTCNNQYLNISITTLDWEKPGNWYLFLFCLLYGLFIMWSSWRLMSLATYNGMAAIPWFAIPRRFACIAPQHWSDSRKSETYNFDARCFLILYQS